MQKVPTFLSRNDRAVRPYSVTVMMVTKLVLALALVLTAQALAQTPSEIPLPSFTGVLRGLDSKSLILERPDANTMDFNCTRKTKFYDGAKQIKPASLKPGDALIVEVRRALDGSLDAVNVRLDRPTPKKS